MKPVICVLVGLLLLSSATGTRAQITTSPWFGANFGVQQLFIESEPQTVTLGLAGGPAVTVDSIFMANTAFQRTGGSCGPLPFTVDAQSTCTLELTFKPIETGQHSGPAALRRAGTEVGLVSLSGYGVQGILQPYPSPAMYFTPTAMGATSEERVVELRSVGTGVVQVSEIAPASAPFARVGGTCGALPITLQPTQSCSLVYAFSPLQVGMATQSIRVNTTVPGTSVDLSLQGDGAQGSQTIHFPAQAPRTYSAGASFGVDPPATVNSGLEVVYGSTIPSVCTVTGSTVAIVAAGTCTLTADQPGNVSWGAAPQQTQSFGIARASQMLGFPAQSPGSRTFAPGGTFAINPLATSATPNAGEPILYASLDGSVCSAEATTVTMIAPGTCIIAADQAGNANYNAAPQVTVEVQLVSPSFADGFEAPAQQ